MAFVLKNPILNMKNLKKLILIFGVGGTGGNFAKEFCRYVSCLPDEDRKHIKICLIDGDIVEAKNLARQPFVATDVNQSKAEVLADAIAENFDLDVMYYNKYITFVDQIQEIVASMRAQDTFTYNSIYMPMLIGCVDNHRARQCMHEYFNMVQNIIYIDSANEYENGEVVSAAKIDGKIISQPRGFYFPEVLTDTSPSKVEESCEQMNISSPQHIATNIMAGQIILSEVVKFLAKGTIDGGVIFFDAFKPSIVRRKYEENSEFSSGNN